MIKVVVLGCGPTGLLVAHAFERAGHRVDVISRKVKSVIPGSQHLHGPVPGLTGQYAEGSIQFVRIGTAEGYAQKVYGDPHRNTGWENYLQLYPSWSIIKAYDKLWDEWEGMVIDDEISGDPDEMREIMAYGDLVVSTLPAQTLCRNPNHSFEGTPYWIRTLPTPPADHLNEIVVYNGLPDDQWYRWSILGGLCSVEYARPPYPGKPWDAMGNEVQILQGLKAISTDCDCYPEIVRLGRWAQWQHGVTMYKAYQHAERLAKEL